jgi:pimeloyl-ACP methyl ester carboxylesterase
MMGPPTALAAVTARCGLALLLLCAPLPLDAAAAANPAPPTTLQPLLSYSTVVAPDGVPLAVTEWGNPQGPPVLLLHGFSLSSAVWRQQQDPALSARYRFIAVDLRGHGASGKPSTGQSYRTAKVWADDIAAVMAARQLVKPVVVAWSFGGNVVMNYVREYGDANLGGINFIGSTGGLAERLNPVAGDAAYAEADRQRRSEALADNIAGQRAFVRLMTARPLPAGDEELWLVSTLQLPRYVRAAMAGMPLENPDLLDRLRVPTLFTTGATDASVPALQLEPLTRRLPQSELSVFAGAGHAAFAEQPQRFNRELMRFVDSVRSAPQPLTVRERRAIDLVRSYLDAHNRHDVDAAVAHYATEGQFVLSNDRGIVRGAAAIAALERLDAALGSWLAPIGLRARTQGNSVIVTFSHVLEQSAIADAIGVPLIVAESVDDGFVVRGDRLRRVVQPPFAAACSRAMLGGFRGFADWLRANGDPRSQVLLRADGSIVLTAETAPLWIDGVRAWRAATGWAPGTADVLQCARR